MNSAQYHLRMIRSFGTSDTPRLFRRQRVARFQSFERSAQRRLTYLNQIRSDRAGQYSFRINDQWRVCFRWEGNDAHAVEIVDYH
jgi:proteic killer suppression protein